MAFLLHLSILLVFNSAKFIFVLLKTSITVFSKSATRRRNGPPPPMAVKSTAVFYHPRLRPPAYFLSAVLSSSHSRPVVYISVLLLGSFPFVSRFSPRYHLFLSDLCLAFFILESFAAVIYLIRRPARRWIFGVSATLHTNNQILFSPSVLDLRLTVEQVTHVRKPFLMFASTGMLPGSRFFDPVSLAIVMSMQPGLVIPSQQRLLCVFR